jgi:hypothetical protein
MVTPSNGSFESPSNTLPFSTSCAFMMEAKARKKNADKIPSLDFRTIKMRTDKGQNRSGLSITCLLHI